MAYDEALATRIRAQLAGSAGVSEKRMFGGLAFLKNGNMFVGVNGDELMARVGKENYADSLARKHVREMDFTGKPLAGYVFVGAQGIAKDTDLGFWVQRCQAFAETLPAKARK